MNELTRRIGKFDSPESLLKAYEALNKEFTKRCQKLKETEKENDGLKARLEDKETFTEYAKNALCDENFVSEYVLPDENIKTRIIEMYLDTLVKTKAPATLCHSMGSSALTPPSRPKSLGEAKRLAEIILNS